MGCSVIVAVQCGATKTRMGICITLYLNSSNNSFVISNSNNCTTSNFMSDNNKHSSSNTTVINNRSSSIECGSSSCNYNNSKVISNSC